MKKVITSVLAVCLLVVLPYAASAREARKKDMRPMQQWTHEEYAGQDLPVPEYRNPYFTGTSAAVDTYTIVYYDFETMNWQGWTRVDNTAQPDTFWHVEDYLEPELAGFPGPLEGGKSAWCGALPGDDEYMCQWVAAPGYGNLWKQSLVSDPIYFIGPLTFSYKGHFDSESDHDRTFIEYDAGDGNWTEFAAHDDVLDTVAVHQIIPPQAATKLRFHFVSDGGWSDEDGLWTTDGAAHIDSITVTDNTGILDFEDFESAQDGDKNCGIWHSDVEEAFGKYSGLTAGLAEKDPCGYNLSTQIMFFAGSPYASSEYPGLYDTPFCKGPGGLEWPCQDEMVVSPVIDMTKYSTGGDENQDADIPAEDLPKLGGVYFKFSVYRDLPFPNLVFYHWMVRNIENSGCPRKWEDRGLDYYGGEREYRYITNSISDLVDLQKIQVCFMILDMCDVWYGVYGDCAAHTPSPWFDNVLIQSYKTNLPQWSHRDLDIFQDNFPGEEFDLESYVRADAANDLRPGNDPIIDPGDSIVVTCTSPLGGGLDTTPDGLPKIFMQMKCTYIGDPLSPKPALYGPQLEGNYGRYYSDDGSTWTIIQGEKARKSQGNIVPDRYMFDLNDSLFTRAYRIDYYFKAYDHAGESGTLPHYAESREVYFEWTCLPTLASDILYVDDYHGRGTLDGIVQLYFDNTFPMVIPYDNQPDRYDVNSPSSMVSNGPGSRAKNNHLTTAYGKVIWDSGNLGYGTITDGSSESDKSNDCRMLVDWMNLSPHHVGLWVLGDNIAQELNNLTSAVALELMTTYCGVALENGSYFDLTGGLDGGGIANPKVTADSNPANPLWHTTWGDSLYAFGGCPVVNGFDVLEKAGNGDYALSYPDFAGQPHYAGIYSENINDSGYDIRTVWFGFSFMYIRDCDVGTPIARAQIMHDVLEWMHNPMNVDLTEISDVPAANSLAQNFPNPFNPVTKIRYGLDRKGPVTLKIYNVAGQMIRTLVEDVKEAGVYEATWDGRNDNGSKIASGIYFYKMETGYYTSTRKMVLVR